MMSRILIYVGLGMAAVAATTCCPKVHVDPLPPKVVVVREGCIDKPPPIPTIDWPAPNANGTYTITSRIALDYLRMLNWVDEVYEQCRVK